MTANRRIFLNIIATYGRSLYGLVCGLCAGRWALMALGEVDYGLFGVVGGLTGFIAFFNSVLAFSIARFYATTITRTDECQRWFSIAVVVHAVVPIVLMIMGYPLGVWAIENYLTVPQDRVNMCVWVFRFVCLSCFLSMVSVPFNAMYQARQYIAELTVYSFVTTTFNIAFLYYMVTHPGVWLARYAFWTCLLAIVPQIIIAIRALTLFPECRFRWEYAFDGKRIRGLFAYTGWQLFGATGSLLRTQGTQILVNKYYGPSVNAAMAVANQVNTQTQSLAGAMVGAFQPAISTAYGSGDCGRMKTLAYTACKFGLLLCLVFVLPLALELREVMIIWLKKPPLYVVEFCWCMMLVAVIDRSSIGHMLAINAKGKLSVYQLTLGGLLIATLPIAWGLATIGIGSVLSVGGALILTMSGCSMGRVLFARSLVGMSVRIWMLKIALPTILAIGISSTIGLLPRYIMGASLCRVFITGVLTEISFLSSAWLLILTPEERGIVESRIRKVLSKIWMSFAR